MAKRKKTAEDSEDTANTITKRQSSRRKTENEEDLTTTKSNGKVSPTVDTSKSPKTAKRRAVKEKTIENAELKAKKVPTLNCFRLDLNQRHSKRI